MGNLTQFSRSIEGSVALITGAASGIGRATAKVFAAEGAKLAITDIDDDGLQTLRQELATAGCECYAMELDLNDQKATENVASAVQAHFGQLDILVNNAGLAFPVTLDAEDYDDAWSTCLNVMLSAQQWLIRAALPMLRLSAHPRIINVASTEALGAASNNSPYVVAKHGSVGLTRALAVELGGEGITVNCVCPGMVDTGITAAIPDDYKQMFAENRSALKRIADPEEVGHVILSLCLPAASYVTGALVPVDGGFSIRNG